MALPSLMDYLGLKQCHGQRSLSFCSQPAGAACWRERVTKHPGTLIKVNAPWPVEEQ